MPAKATEEPSTRVLPSPATTKTLEDELRTVLAEACAELNDRLRKHDLEIIAIPPQLKRTAEFDIQHLSDKHSVGLIRATVFTPIVGNDQEGRIVLKGFRISLQVHLDEDINEFVTLEEKSLLNTRESRETFKEKVQATILAAVKPWAA